MTGHLRKKIAFITGTRADFGKLKALLLRLQHHPDFEVHLFVTGMHMLAKYGYTALEVERCGFPNIHKFINQNARDGMDHVLAKTIAGFADYVREVAPDAIVVHGDRVEALAGATVGALNHVLTCHIEGGEVSGTVDELIRHAVTKLAHVHFVANDQARQRLVQLGEREEAVHVIGSPDVDVMNSDALPTLAEVRERYGFSFERYAVLAFHPVTSEVAQLRRQARELVDAVLSSGRNFVGIYPNNDAGSDIIFEAYERLTGAANVRLYPSMRFEHFLTLLKNADFILGNSSAGVREAPHYGVPTLNVGSRQHHRTVAPTIRDLPLERDALVTALASVDALPRTPTRQFGDGHSAASFVRILETSAFWETARQKFFIDRELVTGN